MRTVIVGALFGVVTGCAEVTPPSSERENDGPARAASGVSPEPPSCGTQTFRLDKAPPNVMLALDRSGSMSDSISSAAATTSKWGDLQSAIGALIDRYDADVRLGATFFAADDDCAPGVVGTIAPANGATILDALAQHSPGGNTPTAATLDALIASHALADASRANYLVLATDGMPNCGDTEVTRRIAALYASTPSVRTFVIGIGSETDSSPDFLNAWADAGGTARAGDTRYYQTNSSTALDDAFDAIAHIVVSCDFHLSAAPDASQYMTVTENGVLVPRSAANGWTYDATSHTVTLHGAACDEARSQTDTNVAVDYGCPVFPIP